MPAIIKRQLINCRSPIAGAARSYGIIVLNSAIPLCLVRGCIPRYKRVQVTPQIPVGLSLAIDGGEKIVELCTKALPLLSLLPAVF